MDDMVAVKVTNETVLTRKQIDELNRLIGNSPPFQGMIVVNGKEIAKRVGELSGGGNYGII